MRGSRTKDIDKANVILAKVKTPDITLQEIQEETGVNYETARKILEVDLPEVVKSSERIARIVDNDLESVETMSLITKRFAKETLVKEQLDRADVSVANTTTESAFKRSQILQERPTEIVDI